MVNNNEWQLWCVACLPFCSLKSTIILDPHFLAQPVKGWNITLAIICNSDDPPARRCTFALDHKKLVMKKEKISKMRLSAPDQRRKMLKAIGSNNA